MKKFITVLLIVVTCFTSCHKYDGNYELKKLDEIKIEGIPSVMHLMRKIERLVVTPKITSSMEGEIKADNPNYSFRYRLGYKGKGFLGGEEKQYGINILTLKGEPWIDLTPTNGFNLDMPTDFEEGNYVCWFTITDKRNNVVHSHVFEIQVKTLTYQGWMVLSHMGPQERVRLDMISHARPTTEVLYDIAEGLPQIHHGTQITFNPDKTLGDQIAILSKEGSYVLDNSSLEYKPNNDYNKVNFLFPPAGETMIYHRTHVNTINSATISDYPQLDFVISDAGNVCTRKFPTYGKFGNPINKAGNPQLGFKVAPFVGIGEARPKGTYVVVFYDKDNKRFMKNGGNFHVVDMQEIPGAQPLFPYKTGRDMVYMEGTLRNKGTINAILQDAQGKRSLYGMRNSTSSAIVQDYYIQNVTAPGFEQATLFAFDPQNPFMFYAVGNKVYLYSLVTKTAKEMTNIAGGEITTLKFNLWKMPNPGRLSNQSTEFLNQQLQLIVGTFDNSVSNGNGGKVAFYEVDGTTNTLKMVHEYGGFGKVKDVTYRERFQ